MRGAFDCIESFAFFQMTLPAGSRLSSFKNKVEILLFDHHNEILI